MSIDFSTTPLNTDSWRNETFRQFDNQEKYFFTVSSKSTDMENSKGLTSAALLRSLIVFH